MKNLFLAALMLVAGSASGNTVSTPLNVTVVPAPQTPPSTVGNMTVQNSSPTAGSVVNVSFTGASGVNFLAWGWQHVPGVIDAMPTGGAASGNVTMPVPNVASDRPITYTLESLTSSDGGLVATGPSITVPPTMSQTLGNALPASAGGNPFVPAHVITVCPSGCNFAHPQDAISQAQNNGWDNVEITVEAADYPFDNTGATGTLSNRFYVHDAPAHLWVKGIVGNSGTDGTLFPKVHGTCSSGCSLLDTGGNVQTTFDNIEFSGFDYWNSVLNGHKTTLRNVYIHDADQGILSSDGPHHDLYIYNSHIARNGSGNGPDHNIYAGAGDNTDTLTVQNSVVEQVNVGHDIKSRASTTTLICDKLMINSDNVYNGSEMTDCSEGRVCSAHNVLYVEGGGNRAWSNDQSFDAIRYGADREFTTLAQNQLDVQNSVFIDDVAEPFRFLNLFRRLSPSPPYLVAGNTFVFHDSGDMLYGNNPFTPKQDSIFDSVSSAVVHGNSNDPATSTDITLDGTNHWYSDRSAAGMPAIGTYPLSFNDPSFNGVMPAACTDPIGLVKIPAN